MMAKMDLDCIPPYAVVMWRDDSNIYVALPMTAGGPPYITRYPVTEGGLSAALEVLRKRKHEVLSPTEAQVLYKLPDHQPQVQVKLTVAQTKLHAETTPEQREKARALLERLGLKR